MLAGFARFLVCTIGRCFQPGTVAWSSVWTNRERITQRPTRLSGLSCTWWATSRRI